MIHRRGRYSCVDRCHPQAFGICDRGGEAQRRVDLFPEQHWTGGRLRPTGFLSCLRHMDVPNPQFGGQRPLRPDPVPVRNPRPPDGATSYPLRPGPEPMRYVDGSYMLTADGALMLSFDDPVFGTMAGDVQGAGDLPLQDAYGRPLGPDRWTGL